ncbi:MAG: TonB-dependent receptor, partial [Alphaproteobacteria bacterium]
MRNAVLAALLGAAVSTMALAQEAETTSLQEEGEAVAPAKPDRPTLDEVVVTAQKRAENLQDVPLSVSVVSGDTLREKNIDNFNDLSLYTPNVKISAGSVVGFVKMRGLGSGNNKGFEQAVGYIVDGVYYGRLNYLGGAMLDMERVEILRGPQGTLMGKNTIAGAINIATGRPENEWGADLSYAMGDYEKKTITGIVTGPIVEDVLSFRVAARRDRRDGFMYNATQERDELNVHTNAVRAKLAFDGIEKLSVVATVEARDYSQRVWGFQVNKATPQMATLYSTFDPRFNDNDQDRVGYFDQNGDALREILTGVLQADYEWGDFTISSITGWSNMDQSNLIDADFGPAPILTLGSAEEWTQWSQELRVVSPPGDIDYVAGLYFFGSELSNDSDLKLLPDVDPLDTVGGVLIPDALQPIADQIPGLGTLTADSSQIHFNQESFSVALYGQANWHINEDWTLAVGARVSYEEKEANSEQEFENTGLFFVQFLGQEEYVTSGSRSEFDFSPKLSVTYEFTDDLTGYATVAQAYKGGG